MNFIFSEVYHYTDRRDTVFFGCCLRNEFHFSAVYQCAGRRDTAFGGCCLRNEFHFLMFINALIRGTLHFVDVI